MRTLLSERYAPITSTIGFLRTRPSDAVAELGRWHGEGGDTVDPPREVGDFPDALLSLQPLVLPYLRRELFVPTAGPWTAYFNCAANGTDAGPAIAVLAQRLECEGLVVTCQLGAVMFTVADPKAVHPPRRAVVAMDDGGRWIFETSGEPLPFEELDRYRTRRVRDRFTSDMLERYCQALDVDVFNGEFYRGPAVLVSHTPPTETFAQNQARVPLPPGAAVAYGDRDPNELLVPRDQVSRSLAEAQRHLGIVPGRAEQLPG
jgi:hypothetical protein